MLPRSKFVYIDWQNDYDKYVMWQCDENCPYVFLNNPPDKRPHGLIWFLYKMHMSPKVNKVIPLPFKKLWNRFILEKRIKKAIAKQDRVIFIFPDKAQYAKTGFTQYLKKSHPNSLNAYLFSDKVEITAPFFSIDTIKSEFDAVLSYNDKDVEKYSLIKDSVKPCDFSNVQDDDTIEKSDIFYVGKDKGRLKDILTVFEKAKALNLKCDFTILGVPEEQRKYCDEIEYEKRIPYLEMLKRVRRSKCILNIMQEGAEGITLRDYEAITMNKFLITNSKAIKDLPNYNKDMVIDLENIDEQLDKIIKFDENASWNSNIVMPYDEYFYRLEKSVCTKVE